MQAYILFLNTLNKWAGLKRKISILNVAMLYQIKGKEV